MIIFISYFFIFTITVAPNPYPRSVTFFNLSFFNNLSLSFYFMFFFTQVQNCNSLKIGSWCKFVFVQFCFLVQICPRTKVSSGKIDPSCNFIFVQFSPLIKFDPFLSLEHI